MEADNRITDIRIRLFEPEDQAGARRLINEGLGEHFGYVDESQNPDLDDIHNCYVEAGNTFLVAVSGGTVVGTVALLSENETAGRLARMSVASSWRRRGIATALFSHLVAAAGTRGFSRLVLAVEVPWTEAIRFYAGCGFVEYARDEVDVHLELSLD